MALSTIDAPLTITVGGNVTATGTVEPAGDTAAGDNAAIGFTAAEGLILTGQGSTADITIKNDADTLVASVATGTTVMNFASAITVGGSALSNTATNAAVTGTVVKGTTSLQTPLIEFTDGDDAMAIADGGVVTFSQKPTFSLGNRGYTHLVSAGVAVGGTAAAALAFSSTHITSAFTNYMLVIENVQPATDSQNLIFRPSVDNGTNFTATTLHNLRSVRLSDGGNINNVDGDGGVAALSINSGNDATSGCSGIVHLNGFTDATNFKYFVGHTVFLEASSAYTGWFAASYHTTTAFNHINLTFGSGNIRSGFIHLYGLGE